MKHLAIIALAAAAFGLAACADKAPATTHTSTTSSTSYSK